MNQRRFARALAFSAIFAITPSLFADSGLIATIAGGGTGDVGGLATNMALSMPTTVALDAAGNLYICEFGRNRIVRVDAVSGIATLATGNGQSSFSGDGGPATLAAISYAGGIVFDAAGNLVFSDTSNNRLRRIDAQSGIVTTIVGTGSATSSGDGGPASAAALNTPRALALDRNGNLFIGENLRVRRVDAATGIITTFAGTGTSTGSTGDGNPAIATAITPTDVAVDATGNLYIGDATTSSVRRVDAVSGLVSTVAGAGPGNSTYTGDGALATSSGIGYPGGVRIDSAGNIFITWAGNNRILKVDAVTRLLCTVAGNGMAVSSGDQGLATSASLNGPFALAVAPNGNVIASEVYGNRVRRISLPSPLTYTTTALSPGISGQTVTLTAAVNPIGSGTPTGSVQFFDSFTLLGTAQINSGTAVFATSTLPAGPRSLTASYGGDSAFNSSTSMPVSVTATPLTPIPTSVTLVSTNNPSLLNATVNFVVTISPTTDNNGHSPTNIALQDNTTGWAVWTSVTPGHNQIPMTFSQPGNHSMTAVFSGDAYFAASSSPVVIQVVKSTPSVNIASDTNPSLPGGTVNITASIAPSNATGTITFTDQSSVPGTPVTLATVPLTNGAATFTTSSLSAGTHYITANYNGDANFMSAASSYITQIVKIGSTATISTAQNPSFPNQTIFISCQVAPVTGTSMVPTGTVQLLDGATVLGTATLSGGSAQFQTSFPATGSHSLTAVYSGDGNFGGSTSAALNESVKNLASAVVSADINPATAGATVTFTGTILQSSTATGTMTFEEYPTPSSNAVPLATVTMTNGRATFSISTLSVGPHLIAVAYSGDANFVSSGSGYIVETIRAVTTTSVTAVANSVPVGQAVVFTAQVSPATATGTVQLMDGSTSLGTVTLNNGAASLSVSTLSVGTHSITAVYSGDTGNAGSTSAAWTQTITKIVTTVSLASSANPATYGQPVTLTATISPAAATGSVQFMDGSTSLGTGTITNGTASISTSALTAGSHSLTAVYSGDATNAGSTSTALTQTISQAATSTSLSSSANPSTYPQPVTLTATVSPATATGTVQFLDGSTSVGTGTLTNGTAWLSITTLTAGTHTITVVYSGDTNDAGSTSAALTQTVNKISTTTAVASSTNPAASGQPITLTATVSPATATGTVQFLDGSTSLGTGTLTSGAASLSIGTLTPGTHAITVVYSGDANDAGSTSAALTQTVNKISTTTAVATSANPATYGQSVTLTATVSPSTATGSIQFMDGATSLGRTTISNGTASFSTAAFTSGSHSLSAIYSGDANNNGSTSATLTQVINSSATTTALQASPANPIFGQAVQLTATVAPANATGTIQFLDSGSLIGSATIVNGTASTTVASFAAGAHTLTALYSGDTNDATSTSAPVSVTVSQANSTAAVASSANPSIAGQAVTFTATVAPTGATGTVQFLDGSTALGTVTLSAGSASLNVSTLSAGSHTITASYSGNGNYKTSSASLSQTVNAPPPGAPSALTATAASTSQINLTWTASTTSGVTYNIYSSTASGFTPSVSNRIASGVTSTSYSNTGLLPSMTYYYVVKAQNSGGESAGTSQASATTQAAGGGSCHVVYSITTQWNVGFGTAITIQNTGTKPVNGWKLSWTWAGNQQITQSWNSNYTQTGTAAALTNATWNSTIAPGATISGMGFNGSYSGTDPTPTAFYLNGTLCN